MTLSSRYVLVQSTFFGQFKMEINQHKVNSYLATKNFNTLFSLTFVIFFIRPKLYFSLKFGWFLFTLRLFTRI